MSITIKPIFIKDNIEFPFRGQNEERGFAGRNHEYRFIVNTLRHHFSDNLDFVEKDGVFIIPFPQNGDDDDGEEGNVVDMVQGKIILQSILQNSNEYFEGDAELESAQLKFEIMNYA
jgi:hypothetical protein